MAMVVKVKARVTVQVQVQVQVQVHIFWACFYYLFRDTSKLFADSEPIPSDWSCPPWAGPGSQSVGWLAFFQGSKWIADEGPERVPSPSADH